MALRGPVSVLDRREPNTGSANIVRDRLTRHRSPVPSENLNTSFSDDSEDIDCRIPQPYRTSFSAITAPGRIRRDRSRSTSPATSSLKGSSRARSKSPKSRRSHKHVTYNNQVVVRDSDTSGDNISFTNLSDVGLDDTLGHFSASGSMLHSDMMDSSQRDYSSELHELSQQIIAEYSGISDSANHSPVLSSQSKNQNHVKASTPNGKATVDVSYGSRKPKEPIKQIPNGSDRDKKLIIQEDYDHDRTVSYRVAIKNNYSDEIQQQADTVMEEYSTQAASAPQQRSPVKEIKKSPEQAPREQRERSSSFTQENDPALEKSRLTHQKRSISASIGNFFRRMSSPHSSRRKNKGNVSAASSSSLTAGDDLDGSFHRHGSSGSLSRGKLRRSLMKLVGRGSKKSKKSSNKSDTSVEDEEPQNDRTVDSKSKDAVRSDRYMKSIEQSSQGDKDIYRRFKDRQTTPTRSEDAVKPGPMKTSPRMTSSSSQNSSISDRGFKSVSAEALNSGRVFPPDSLDVKLVPKSIKSLQASQISTLSGDDSIGECSIDPNLTGSEPSLLSESSKQVAVSQISADNVSPTHSPPPCHEEPIRARNTSPSHSEYAPSTGIRGQVNLRFGSQQMPIYPECVDFFPTDTPPRTPSYLRISSAVSGYGHYSKYSAYKGIEKRSPYSSTLSLRSSRSDLTTPQSPADMPIGKIPNIQPPTNWPPIKNEILSPTQKSFDQSSGFKCESKDVINDANVNTVDNSNVDELDSGDSTPVVINGANCTGDLSTRVNGNHIENGNAGFDDSADSLTPNYENGHSSHVENFISTGNADQDAEFFLSVAQQEEERMLGQCSQCEAELSTDSVTEEACGRIRAAVGKANLLVNQKFNQFRELCHRHKCPEVDGKPTKWEDLQGFWEMVKLQVDDVDIMFTEIELMKQNGWREVKIPSRRSSSSSRSSPKSSSLNVSNASTPSHTPGSKRRAARVKDTPESSPERSMKAKQAAKERDDARKKMLAEKRAAMKKQRQQDSVEAVEIYVADNNSKSESPARSTGSGSEV